MTKKWWGKITAYLNRIEHELEKYNNLDPETKKLREQRIAEQRKIKQEVAEATRQKKQRILAEKRKQQEERKLLNVKEKARKLEKEKAEKRAKKRRFEDNAFIRGRECMNDLYGSVVDYAANYRRACVALAIALAVCVVVIWDMSGSVRVVPYVVEKSPDGTILSVFAARRMPRVTDKIVAYFIRDFIINTRSVSPDNVVQKLRLAKAYSAINNNASNLEALTIFQKYITDNNPFVLNKTITRNVEVHPLLKEGGDCFRTSWTETTRNLAGTVTSKKNFIGEFTYKLGSVTAQQVQNNPFGVFITNINWSADAATD